MSQVSHNLSIVKNPKFLDQACNRYDDQNKKRITTIEPIADEQDWQPNTTFIPKNKIVQIKINYGEIDLAKQVKSLGGRWNREKKVWNLPYGSVQALGLVKRIVD